MPPFSSILPVLAEEIPMIVTPEDGIGKAKHVDHDKESQNTDRERAQTIQRTKGLSATAGLVNFICGMIGPGCFALALSFKQAGFVLVFIIGGLSLFSMSKIVKCSQYLAKLNGDQKLDYGQMAAAAMQNSYPWARRHGNLAKIFVNICSVSFQLGVISVFLVFSADHIIEIYEFIAKKPIGISKELIILIFFVPQMALNLINHIRLITIVSLLGNVIIFGAIALITKELFTHSWYPISELPAITSIEGISLASGALVYSFEGQAMVLPLENSLRHPQDMIGFTGVLSTAMNLVTLLYAFLGFFGYLTFGDAVQGSITLNLPNNVLSVVVKCLLVLKMFLGSAIQLYAVVHMLLPTLEHRVPDEKPILKRSLPYILRVILMIIPLGISLAIPNLMQIIPLVGITSGIMISLIIPSIVDTLVFLPLYAKQGKRRDYWIKLIINLTLFVLGWFFLGCGLYSSIDDIVHIGTLIDSMAARQEAFLLPSGFVQAISVSSSPDRTNLIPKEVNFTEVNFRQF
ncbi:unnamed protein product [Caenorhabditis bovis]|uniref:Amino acid transporter transmembrane domain-containing protein n=1 Tax=Caenorhabditis bovis TaxID=2654633 RepID=A0A8S1F443_9PELO|nr:unnamed protein product [Caenorhabditis bovis]